MSAASTRPPDVPDVGGEFARQAALRGRMDPAYHELSDHWTSITQRLYPVWVKIGPGLSDPGHIDLRSRTTFLDADELLGTLEEIKHGRLERERILGCFGVNLHEVFHAKHTKLWILEANNALCGDGEEQLAADRQLLEEPRMEAHGVRDFPPESKRGRFVRLALQTAIADHMLPHFQRKLARSLLLSGAVSRDLAGTSMVYLKAREGYGGIAAGTLAPLEDLWQRVLGADRAALEDLFARLIWCPDGDSAQLTHYAREYREIIGPPEQAPQCADMSGTGGAAGSGDDQPPPHSLEDALEQAIANAQQAAREQVDADRDVRKVAAEAAPGPRQPGSASPAAAGGGIGKATGRLPDRGVDRPPFADERAEMRRYAQALSKARSAAVVVLTKRNPGGRFNARSYVRALGERQAGLPARSQPWELSLPRTSRLLEPHFVLVIDTSGSMGGYEYALGPIAWILHEGVRAVGGRLAIALFGNGSGVLCDGRAPLKLVPGIKTGGGTQYAGDALVLGCDELDMRNPARPRLVYCLSDGGWYDTAEGVERIHELREVGVPTNHIAIGPLEPLSVDADRISLITDPADALSIVAADSVELLAAYARHRRPRRLAAA
jgi:hypothetical protein